MAPFSFCPCCVQVIARRRSSEDSRIGVGMLNEKVFATQGYTKQTGSNAHRFPVPEVELNVI